jgi:O-antigen ligase/tetratricopeptide (TPR) repeat protein
MSDRVVLVGLQVLVLGVPLLLGGMHDLTLPLFVPLALALLATTVAQRIRRGVHDAAPGIAVLALLVGYGLLTTLPLPPAALDVVAPATAKLYRATLPGWPHGGGWSAWRPVSWEAWATWRELLRFAIAFGAFAVVTAYPWAETAEGRPGRQVVVERLLLTIIAGGLLFAGLGFLQQASGADAVLWVFEADTGARLSGPFVDPDHLALWLEMMLPATAAYAYVVTRRTQRRLADAARSGRSAGVKARRAWASAVLANQTRLWPPLVGAATVMLLVGAHAATDSRGGRAGLLAGLVVTGVGLATLARKQAVQRIARLALPILLALVVVGGTAGYLVLASHVGDEESAGDLETTNVDVMERIAVAARGAAVVAEHPLLGTGLGTWLHAFRPHQAPPVEDGIWDHAHNDYLELGAETGVLGLALTALFAALVARAVRRREPAAVPAEEESRRSRRRGPAGFGDVEEADWRAALRDHAALRFGLLGGVIAILVHSAVDFGLRMPANLVELMTIAGVLVLLAPPARGRTRFAPAALLVLVAMVAAMPVTNAVRQMAGAAPLSPEDAQAQADALLADDGDSAGAVALLHRAIDLSPADRDLHRALADALGSGPASIAERRRAIALDPWAPELRDELALALWNDGRRVAAARELEESIARYPHLLTHAFLAPDSGVFPPTSSRDLLREIADGETLSGRLAQLDDLMAGALERGLRRGLETHAAGEVHDDIVSDVVTLLEARRRWTEAADALTAASRARADDSESLERAARNYLKAGNLDAAETTLLTAIKRTPEQGVLYQKLAVDVYAKRGDFDSADVVLDAGTRNADDMTPVYRGMTEVLSRRDMLQPLIGVAPEPSDDDDDRHASAARTLLGVEEASE